MKILLLGAGGFIGVNLTERLLEDEQHDVVAVDIDEEKIAHLLHAECPRLDYRHLNIADDDAGISALVAQADVVVDLVAFANPALYVDDPVGVFDLNFIQNMKVVDQCRTFGKRLVQFSTCEVYGMTPAKVAGEFGLRSETHVTPFSEDFSPLIMGPVKNHRWIYACAKQLLERVLDAYWKRDGFRFSVIRPFNFIGPRIDFLPSEAGGGNPRVFAHFMDALLYGNKPIELVDGGEAFRAYTHIDDAVDCIVRVIEDTNNNCDGQIFNIGQPENELRIRELAVRMCDLFDEHFRREGDPPRPEMVTVSGEQFYGEGYEDCDRRVADITKARTLLGWEPRYGIDEALVKTMDYFVSRHRARQQQGGNQPPPEAAGMRSRATRSPVNKGGADDARVRQVGEASAEQPVLLRNQLENLRRREIELEQDNEALRSRCERLEQELRPSREELDQLKRERNAVEDAYHRARAQLQRLQEEGR
jgi:nucleoside-diphosphate-sugar epimerase